MEYLPDGRPYYPHGKSILNHDEWRFVLLKVVDQAKKDFLNLYLTTDTTEALYWRSAKSFLFQDTYTIDWGDYILSLKEILELLGYELLEFRARIEEQFFNLHGDALNDFTEEKDGEGYQRFT